MPLDHKQQSKIIRIEAHLKRASEMMDRLHDLCNRLNLPKAYFIEQYDLNSHQDESNSILKFPKDIQ